MAKQPKNSAPDADAFEAMLKADPSSYDMGMLKPLREQLKQTDPNDPQAQMMQQVVDKLYTEQCRRLDSFAVDAGEDFEKACKAKREVELRWIDDCLMYDGDEKLKDSKAYPNDAGDQWSNSNERPAYRAIRSRTLRYAARLVDMLLPGNDIPIKVEATPKPDPDCFPALPQGIDQAGLLDFATDCASRMDQTIKDQLSEQRFQDGGRRTVFQASKLGTGIFKGPIMDYRKRRKPKGPQSEIVLDESPIPGGKQVDSWLFYDDMSPSLEECSQCFEVHISDRRALMDMKRYPNVIEENIDLLLKEDDPQFPKEFKTNITHRNQRLNEVEAVKDRWAVIEMHGVIDPEEVQKITGQEWTDSRSLPLVEFWFCNDKAIKFKLSALECDWRVPYYNFTPFPCDDTIWGYGIPRMGRGGGKIIRGALSATMANASVSAGPLVAILKGAITPADGEFRISSTPKVVEIQSDVEDISKAIQSFQIQGQIEQNLALLQKGCDLLDDDILLDQVIQGDISDEEVPASGLLQIINLRTIFQRLIAAGADDSWFKPMGERWVQWNIQFNPDPSIKGDFDTKGIASTTLVSKDLQLQHLSLLMQMSAQPQFAGFSDNYEMLASYSRMLDIPNRDKLVFPKDQAQQNQQQMQQQGGDPMVAVKQQELQLKGQQMQSDAQFKAQEIQFAHEERMAEVQRQMQKDQLDAQAAREQNDTNLAIAQMKFQTAVVQLSQESKQQIWQIMQALKKTNADNFTKIKTAQIAAGETAAKEHNANIRAGAQIAASAHEKAADIQKEHVHKAVDVQMQREQQKHEKSMPKPQVNDGNDQATE